MKQVVIKKEISCVVPFIFNLFSIDVRFSLGMWKCLHAVETCLHVYILKARLKRTKVALVKRRYDYPGIHETRLWTR